MLKHRSSVLIEEWSLWCVVCHRVGGSQQTRVDTVVTCCTEAQTGLQVRKPAGSTLQELLVRHTPSQGCWWEDTPTVVLAKLTGTIGTNGNGSQILVVECIVDTAEVRENVLLCLDITFVWKCCTCCCVCQYLVQCEWSREGYRSVGAGYVLTAAPLLTYQYIDVVTTMEKLLVVVSQCICVTPVLVLQAYELCLWLTVVTILRVGSCIRTPNLFGIVVLPAIAEFRTECDIFKWLPV